MGHFAERPRPRDNNQGVRLKVMRENGSLRGRTEAKVETLLLLVVLVLG